MNTPKTVALKGILCTVVGGIFWGFSGTCGEYLFSHYEVSTLWVTCVRELGAGIALLLLAVVRRAPGLTGIWKSWRDAVRLVLFALGGLVLCQYSYMTAISYTNAGTTTVLQNLNLVIIMVLVCIAGRRWPRKKELLAAVLAVAGTFLLATHGDPRHMVLSTQGLFWGLTTAVAVTIYTLLPSRLISKWGSTVVMGWGMLVGGTCLSLGSRIWREQVEVSSGLVLTITVITLLGTVVAFGLFMYGISQVGPVRASMLATTEPVSAAVFSALWLHTSFQPMDLLGFACILATVFLLAGKDERAAQPPSDEGPSLPSQATEKP